jgi:hypothetical protein
MSIVCVLIADAHSEDDSRQMAFDLDNAYNAFHRFVQEKK